VKSHEDNHETSASPFAGRIRHNSRRFHETLAGIDSRSRPGIAAKPPSKSKWLGMIVHVYIARNIFDGGSVLEIKCSSLRRIAQGWPDVNKGHTYFQWHHGFDGFPNF